MPNNKNLQSDAGSIVFEGLYDPSGHQFVAKEAGAVGNDGGNLYAPSFAATDGAIATIGTTTDAPGANTVVGQIKRLNPATANTALVSPPATTTAVTDTPLTFGTQVNHWCLQNNSTQVVYYNLDAAASTSTLSPARQPDLVGLAHDRAACLHHHRCQREWRCWPRADREGLMPTGLLVQQIGLLVYNVVTYGATGNGVTNDYAAIQAAITACANAGGGIVFFPVGTYLIMSTLIVNNDNVHLVGTGHGSIIVAGSGVASAQMLWVQGPATTFRYGFAIYDLSFWCTGVTGVTGIQLDQTYYATLHNVDIEGIYSVNLYLNGTASYYGAYTHVSHCHLGATPGGAGSAGIGIQTNDHEFITVENSVFNWFNQSGGLAIEFQKTNNVITGCSFDECDTAVLLYFRTATTSPTASSTEA